MGGLGPAARAEVIDGVQTVFIVAAPISALALGLVLLLREVPLRGPDTLKATERPLHDASGANEPAPAPAEDREERHPAASRPPNGSADSRDAETVGASR